MTFLNYILSNSSEIIDLLIEHIKLTSLSVLIAILIGIPIGILICYIKKLERPILAFANILQAIPSMALLGFTIPFLGIGTIPAILMVVLYSLLPIIKNTYTGIANINPQMIEAATGIGLTKWQILTKVQIPLALPVIMSGIRISAVSAVGLMTLAAFCGAGGLGYLVYSGIRSINNYQILSGAIPACLLALFIDYVLGIIENLVTPKYNKDKTKKGFFKREKTQKIILIIVGILLIVLLIFPMIFQGKNDREITIGSMDFTEQEILSYMIKDLIEDRTDISVKQKLSLGSSSIVLSAIKQDDIDLYVDYTGTIYGSVLKKEPNTNVEEVYQISKQEMKEKYDLNVLNDLNFNNTYTLAVTKETHQKYNLKTISDLSAVSNELIFSPTLVFMERKDCWLGLKEAYPFAFKDIIALDGAPRYLALINKESDVIDAYSTDGLLKKYDLVVLEDDKNFFLPYQAIPIANNRILEEFPEIIPLLEELSHYLNDNVMRELNYLVDEEKWQPREVASNFLKQHNLLHN